MNTLSIHINLEHPVSNNITKNKLANDFINGHSVKTKHIDLREGLKVNYLKIFENHVFLSNVIPGINRCKTLFTSINLVHIILYTFYQTTLLN